VALALELAGPLLLGDSAVPAPHLLAGPAARVPAVVLVPLIVGSVGLASLALTARGVRRG
jgi:hypothetical protein